MTLGETEMAATGRSSCFCLLATALALGCLSCGVCAKPFISSVSPTGATAGGNQFLLTIKGSDFRPDAMVSWNGSFRLTTFVNSHQLVAAITAADIAAPGTVLVFAFNPPESTTVSVSGALGGSIKSNSCSGKNSNAVPFTIGP
jgi:hypothetical protein